MASPEGLNLLSSPNAPSIAPTIRSASSINNALLQQLAMPSPSPAKAPTALAGALQDVLRQGSALSLRTAKRPKGNAKIPHAFPLTELQKAKAKLQEKERQFKNLVVLALVLVNASSVGQYCAAAEASEDAGMYAGVVARATNKREWDLAFQKDCGARKRVRGDKVGGRRKRLKLWSSETSVSGDVALDEAENPFLDDSDEGTAEKEVVEEEEIPYFVDLELKNEEMESDVSLCVHAAQAAMAALASGLDWFKDKYTVGDHPHQGGEDEDDASEASNPFLESPATKPKRHDPSSTAAEGVPKSPFETLTALLTLAVTASQTSLCLPYLSGDFTAPDPISFSTTAPIQTLLHDEHERMRANLPVDHDRVKRELDNALKEAQNAERKWTKRKTDAGRRTVACVAGVVRGIVAGWEADAEVEEEEFKGVDGEASDSEEDGGLTLKASLIATLAVVQVTLVACLTADKRSQRTSSLSQNYVAPFSLCLSNNPALRRKLVAELAPSEKESRMKMAAKERDESMKRKSVRAGVAKVVCQMARGVWDSLVPESFLQHGEWETQAAFWSDMKGLEDGDDDHADEDDEERRFYEVERATLAALKLLGYANFTLFSHLFKGVEEWENPNPVNVAGMKSGEGIVDDVESEGDGDEEEEGEEGNQEDDNVEPLDPERMGKLTGNEKISSWLRSVTSSPTTTPGAALDEESLQQEQMTELGDPEAEAVADSVTVEPEMIPEVTTRDDGAGHEDVAKEKEDHEGVAGDNEPNARAVARKKQSGNAKLTSIWRTKKKLSKAKKEASAKALEKARQANQAKVQRKMRERVEAHAEDSRSGEAEGEAGSELRKDGKKKHLSMIGKRKRRTKAQKETLGKAREALGAKKARAGRE